MQPQHNLPEVVGSIFETASERVTAAVAATAVISPIWLPYAHDVAAQWAPVLGCTWLILQISLKVFDRISDHVHRRKDEDDEGEIL